MLELSFLDKFLTSKNLLSFLQIIKKLLFTHKILHNSHF